MTVGRPEELPMTGVKGDLEANIAIWLGRDGQENYFLRGYS